MKARLVLLAAFAPLVVVGPAVADEVRLNGAQTVWDRIVKPHEAQVQQATGVKLVVTPGNSVRGLADLADGKCDIAMVAEPLDMAVKATKAAGKELDQSKLQASLMVNDYIVFITHKSNPVKTLTWQQITDIHTGKITNRKELGGKDMPITVFADARTGGTRTMIQQIVMGGQDMGGSVKTQTVIQKVNEQVGQTEGGFGGLGKGFVDPSKVNIVESKAVERPLTFVTMGAPSPAAAKVIAAFKAQAK